jgi:hypothetical protein
MFVGQPEGRRPIGSAGIDGRIILKCILNRMRGYELDLWGEG